MWLLVFLVENDGEQIPDLIPKIWKIDQKSCWYPKHFPMNKIKSLAKNQASPDHVVDGWECCIIHIVADDIGTNIHFNLFILNLKLIICIIFQKIMI